jgi:hypothetical protein
MSASLNWPLYFESLERDTGFEPATFSWEQGESALNLRRNASQHGKIAVSRCLEVSRADGWRWEPRWERCLPL